MKIEEQLAKLEQITGQLEQSDIPLDQALTLFEEGLALATTVKKGLDDAKIRISKVIESASGTFDLEPLALD